MQRDVYPASLKPHQNGHRFCSKAVHPAASNGGIPEELWFRTRMVLRVETSDDVINILHVSAWEVEEMNGTEPTLLGIVWEPVAGW